MTILFAVAVIFVGVWALCAFRRIVVLIGCPYIAYLCFTWGMNFYNQAANSVAAYGWLCFLVGAWMVLCFLVMAYWTYEDVRYEVFPKKPRV